MGMLDRYRKRGGFTQLLNLLETTGMEKREKFLKMICEESPYWEAELKKKMLNLDRICSWNASFLMEFMPRIPANAIAAAIHPMPQEKRDILLSAIPFAERKKVEDILKDYKANPGEAATCQIKIINEVRSMVASGHLKFEKFDQDMVIPENIEDLLNSGAMGATHVLSAKDSSEIVVEPPPPGLPAAVSEELTQLRKKVVALTQENMKLSGQVHTMKDKLDQIKKIA